MTEDYPTSLRCLYSGLNAEVGPADIEIKRPPWYDDNKISLGQTFAKKNFFSIEYAEMLSLMVLFSFEGNTRPLLFTRKSLSVEAAARRYLSTALRVLSWYEGDLWDEDGEASANFTHVRFMHFSVSTAMNRAGRSNVEMTTKLRNLLDTSDILSKTVHVLNEDFNGVCPAYVTDAGGSPIFINQAEMSFTLFGFMGLVTLYPEYLGIHGARQEDIEGFVHLWRVIGYRLGIEDRYNFCSGTFDEVKSRCQCVVQQLFIPNLVSLNEEWEHLSRCMISGIAKSLPVTTFETSLLYLFWLIGVQSPKFKNTISYRTFISFQISKFVFYILMRIPFIKRRSNILVKRMLKNSMVPS